MEHLLLAIWTAPGADVGVIEREWLPSTLARENVEECRVSVAVDDQGHFAAGDPVGVVIHLGLGLAHDLDDVPERDALYRLAREVNVWRVDPHAVITSTEPT